MSIRHWGVGESGSNHAVWYNAVPLDEISWPLLELDGIETAPYAARALSLAWEFAATAQETVRLVREGEPGTTRYQLLAEPTFVFLDEGDEGTGLHLDRQKLEPDPADRRVVALLVLRAPEAGGNMVLWERREDGVLKLRTIRPQAGMVLVYQPGYLLWEVEAVDDGSLVAIKAMLELT